MRNNTPPKKKMIGTSAKDLAAQADSATLSRSLWNPTGKEPFNPQDRVIGGIRTKQGHDRDMAYYANNPGMQKVLNNRKTKYEDLPNFVAPKNTGGGKLLSKPEFRGVTGRGGCLPGWSMDRTGRCVPKL
jgi:pyruvate/2-oxoglutarate dehydrogenase complex dihydrolipoamide acyltransferase (E2) component